MKHGMAWLGRLLMVALFGSPVALLGGCDGQAGQLCDVICECELCNDRQEDECVISLQAQFDIAEAYGCAEQADAYVECMLDNNDCDDTSFSVSNKCGDDAEDYGKCINDNSDIGGIDDDQQAPTG